VILINYITLYHNIKNKITSLLIQKLNIKNNFKIKIHKIKYTITGYVYLYKIQIFSINKNLTANIKNIELKIKILPLILIHKIIIQNLLINNLKIKLYKNYINKTNNLNVIKYNHCIIKKITIKNSCIISKKNNSNHKYIKIQYLYAKNLEIKNNHIIINNIFSKINLKTNYYILYNIKYEINKIIIKNYVLKINNILIRLHDHIINCRLMYKIHENIINIYNTNYTLRLRNKHKKHIIKHKINIIGNIEIYNFTYAVINNLKINLNYSVLFCKHVYMFNINNFNKIKIIANNILIKTHNKYIQNNTPYIISKYYHDILKINNKKYFNFFIKEIKINQKFITINNTNLLIKKVFINNFIYEIHKFKNYINKIKLRKLNNYIINLHCNYKIKIFFKKNINIIINICKININNIIFKYILISVKIVKNKLIILLYINHNPILNIVYIIPNHINKLLIYYIKKYCLKQKNEIIEIYNIIDINCYHNYISILINNLVVKITHQNKIKKYFFNNISVLKNTIKNVINYIVKYNKNYQIYNSNFILNLKIYRIKLSHLNIFLKINDIKILIISNNKHFYMQSFINRILINNSLYKKIFFNISSSLISLNIQNILINKILFEKIKVIISLINKNYNNIQISFLQNNVLYNTKIRLYRYINILARQMILKIVYIKVKIDKINIIINNILILNHIYIYKNNQIINFIFIKIKNIKILNKLYNTCYISKIENLFITIKKYKNIINSNLLFNTDKQITILYNNIKNGYTIKLLDNAKQNLFIKQNNDTNTTYISFKNINIKPLNYFINKKQIIRHIEGSINGKIKILYIKTINKLIYKGILKINYCYFKIKYLETSYYIINNPKIVINNKIIIMNNIILTDSLYHTKAILHGIINYQDYNNWNTILKIQSLNILLLNNYYNTNYFYGKIFAKINIESIINNKNITIHVKESNINKLSTLFINLNNIKKKYNTYNKIHTNYTINIKTYLSENVNVFLNLKNNIMLHVKGNGAISFHKTYNTVQMIGQFKITEGFCKFKKYHDVIFHINKKFFVNSNSKITWIGDINNPLINIKTYCIKPIFNTLEFTQNSIKLNNILEVKLHVNIIGLLSCIQVTKRIEFINCDNYIKHKIHQIMKNYNNNTQFDYILLLNKFFI
jgi:hypothetical protein